MKFQFSERKISGNGAGGGGGSEKQWPLNFEFFVVYHYGTFLFSFMAVFHIFFSALLSTVVSIHRAAAAVFCSLVAVRSKSSFDLSAVCPFKIIEYLAVWFCSGVWVELLVWSG